MNPQRMLTGAFALEPNETNGKRQPTKADIIENAMPMIRYFIPPGAIYSLPFWARCGERAIDVGDEFVDCAIAVA